jgi:ParB family chromosome partitioning protein
MIIEDNQNFIQKIPLKDLRVSIDNVRKEDVSLYVNELATSIKEIGLQQPIVVVKKDSKYDIIVGQRRFLAFRKLNSTYPNDPKFERIPAIVLDSVDDTRAKVISFSENIHRVDISYSDKMNVTMDLIEKYDNDTQKVADILGVSKQTVRNYLGYKSVPDEVKRYVELSKLSASQAIRVTRAFEDKNKVISIISQMIEFDRSEDRKRFFVAARNHPDEPPEKLAKIIKDSRQLVLYVSNSTWESLKKEADKSKLDIEDLATIAIEEWTGRKI